MEKIVLNKVSKERKKEDKLNQKKKTLFKQTFETIHELNISKNKTKATKIYLLLTQPKNIIIFGFLEEKERKI